MNILESLRDEIDAIDNQIKNLLTERMDICQEIAQYKLDNYLAVSDRKRERQIIKRLSRNEKHKLMIEYIYPTIFEYAKDIQKEYIEDNT